MIILIAGDTHTGKTNLAQKLLEHYKIPYVSIDHLKMGLIRSGNTGLTPESDDDTLTEKLWPVVQGNDQNLYRKQPEPYCRRLLYPMGLEKKFHRRRRKIN